MGEAHPASQSTSTGTAARPAAPLVTQAHVRSLRFMTVTGAG